MATKVKKSKAEKQAELGKKHIPTVDDLLGDLPLDEEETTTVVVNGKEVVLGADGKKKTRVATEPKEPREVKGEMVSFNRSSDGLKVTGMGTLYWVVNSGGKLHYKRADQVTILPTQDQLNNQPDVDVAMPGEEVID